MDVSGSVIGTKCTFSGGQTGGANGGFGEGGAAYIRPGGSFACTDCTFKDNTASQGGAIHNGGGSLSLIRPIFSGNKASYGATFGPDCFCQGPRVGEMRAKLCVGCTCVKRTELAYRYMRIRAPAVNPEVISVYIKIPAPAVSNAPSLHTAARYSTTRTCS